MAQAEEPIRAFLAVELDDAVRSSIADLVNRIRQDLPDVSWTRADNVHLTLRFLGNVTGDFIDQYVERLQPIVLTAAPLRAAMGEVGVFPNVGRPSVIWVGMACDGDTLESIQGESERIAHELGLAPETRRFVPHITIGRPRRGKPQPNLAATLARETAFSAGAMTVDGVSLFSSELTPQGARYTRLHRLTFDGHRSESGI